MKKIWWILISLVAIIIVLVILKKKGVIGKEEGLKIATEKVARRTIIETVNASGKVYPEVEVKVSSDVSGEVVELNVEEGDLVEKGQVLAKIYADIYASQRDQVEANVSQAEAQVGNNKASLESYKAVKQQAEIAFNRNQKLYNDKVISSSEFEQAEQNYKTAKANYNAALQTIRGGEASFNSAKAQLNRANKDLARTTIVSPMSGVVSLLSVKKGERVVGTAQMSGTEMLRIANMNSIVAQVDVGENDIPKVKIGDTALVEIDAYNNRKFKGVVFKIANPNTNTTGTSVEVTNYKVHIRLLPENYKDLLVKSNFPFRPGMSANADIQTKRTDNVLCIALNAVTTRSKDSTASSKKKTDDEYEENKNNTADKQEVVFVLDSTKKAVRKVVVKTDIQDINYIEIKQGLKEGDEVVTAPYKVISDQLKDKTKVEVVAKDKLFEEEKK